MENILNEPQDTPISDNHEEVDEAVSEEEIPEIDIPSTYGDAQDEDEDADGDILASDLDELVREFPELSSLESVSELDGALRYGELRELGLSPREAYLATRKKAYPSARAHLTPATPHSARRAAMAMPRKELKMARELFSNLTDAEIETLYKRVNRV